MIFPKIENTLKAITTKTHRTFAPEEEEPPYIVWDDDSQGETLHGDGKMNYQVIEGTINLFTNDEDDPLFDQIQQGLNSADIAFEYNSKQSEEDTGITHYEWVWNLPRGV